MSYLEKYEILKRNNLYIIPINQYKTLTKENFDNNNIYGNHENEKFKILFREGKRYIFLFSTKFLFTKITSHINNNKLYKHYEKDLNIFLKNLVLSPQIRMFKRR